MGGRACLVLVGDTVDRKTLDHAYYSGGLRFTLWATPPGGAPIMLAYGGAFDWLAKLTSNRRAVYVACGIGTQLVALLFRTNQPTPPWPPVRLPSQPLPSSGAPGGTPRAVRER